MVRVAGKRASPPPPSSASRERLVLRRRGSRGDGVLGHGERALEPRDLAVRCSGKGGVSEQARRAREPPRPKRQHVLVSPQRRLELRSQLSELRAFDEAILQVKAGKALAGGRRGKSYIVRAVTTIHGESDHYGYQDGTPEFPLPGPMASRTRSKDYDDALIEWQADYEAMVKSITGKTQPVPLFVPGSAGGRALSRAPHRASSSPCSSPRMNAPPGRSIVDAPGNLRSRPSSRTASSSASTTASSASNTSAKYIPPRPTRRSSSRASRSRPVRPGSRRPRGERDQGEIPWYPCLRS